MCSKWIFYQLDSHLAVSRFQKPSSVFKGYPHEDLAHPVALPGGCTLRPWHLLLAPDHHVLSRHSHGFLRHSLGFYKAGRQVTTMRLHGNFMGTSWELQGIFDGNNWLVIYYDIYSYITDKPLRGLARCSTYDPWDGPLTIRAQELARWLLGRVRMGLWLIGSCWRV